MSLRLLYGFHAIAARLRTVPDSVRELYVDVVRVQRADGRMRRFLALAQEASVQVLEVDAERLQKLCGHHQHQGVVARVSALARAESVRALLEAAREANDHATDGSTVRPALLLALDGIHDPHNFGAILRSAEAAGVDAVIAPKDRAVGMTPVVARVASGAADLVPCFFVTNLARELRQLRDEHDLTIVGLAEEASSPLYGCDLKRPLVLVLGAEGPGLRRLVREACDELVHIPMQGSIESLNVSVAAGVCLFETVRQRMRQNQVAPNKPTP